MSQGNPKPQTFVLWSEQDQRALLEQYYKERGQVVLSVGPPDEQGGRFVALDTLVLPRTGPAVVLQAFQPPDSTGTPPLAPEGATSMPLAREPLEEFDRNGVPTLRSFMQRRPPSVVTTDGVTFPIARDLPYGTYIALMYASSDQIRNIVYDDDGNVLGAGVISSPLEVTEAISRAKMDPAARDARDAIIDVSEMQRLREEFAALQKAGPRKKED